MEKCAKKKGQWLIPLCLVVVDREAYWWRVRSVQTGKETNIPKSLVAKVYHG